MSDIRVTIVGNSIFSAEIDSQINENTITDWRNTRDILPHKRIELPSEISDKCFKLCQKLKLNFGAIDLIKDQNSNYWFLEINPNGQWAWLEKILNFKIADAIINYLLP
jgi:glutathione synthase/RimK-type ligase-like ATP-grasp enzyme